MMGLKLKLALSAVCAVVLNVVSIAAMPEISPDVWASLDRAIGARGVYSAEESAYRQERWT